jgi:ketopantoate hydroxymethyltransferase
MDDKVTIPKLRAMKESGERIAMLTAYDWPRRCCWTARGLTCSWWAIL